MACAFPAIGPRVALRHHACHVFLGSRLEPHGEAGRQQQVVGSRLGDDAAAGGDHAAARGSRGLSPGSGARSGGSPAGRRAEKSPTGWFRRRARSRRSSSMNGTSSFFGQHGAERGLAGATQADQRDALAAIAREGCRNRACNCARTRASRCFGRRCRNCWISVSSTGCSSSSRSKIGQRNAERAADLAAAAASRCCLVRLRAGPGSARRRAESRARILARHSAPRARVAHALAQLCRKAASTAPGFGAVGFGSRAPIGASHQDYAIYCLSNCKLHYNTYASNSNGIH